ncbi:lasso peptide biosynthesis B2 protein [Chloroflexota bacterium]
MKKLPKPDYGFLYLRIFFFILSTPLLLQLKLPQLKKLLALPKRHIDVDDARIEYILTSVDTILQIGWPVIRTRCYPRGLALYYYLNKAGLNVSLHFGAEKIREDLAGHCWLVQDGEPFSEPEDPRLSYKEVYSFPR